MQDYIKITETNKKISEILAEMRKKFPVWCYFDDDILDKDFPPPKKITTRYFKENIEADEELKDKSADQLKKEGVNGITFRERLLMELQYFDQTGNHLDIENVTLCSGSRDSDGGVPRVNWRSVSRKLYVDWNHPRYSDSRLRARAVGSNPRLLKLSPFEVELEKRVENIEKWIRNVKDQLL